jgi:SNF2 family DNA or RNA helicase
VIRLDAEQETAKRWFLEHDFTILGDDPGIYGKSYPALAALQDKQPYPCLLVVPAYLIPNWKQYLDDMGFDRRYWQNLVESDDPKMRLKAIDHAIEYDINIVSWEYLGLRKNAGTKEHPRMVVRYSELEKVQFESIVADESHRLRGRHNGWTEWMWRARKRVKYGWLLTGTPWVRDVSDLWAQLKFLDPWKFSSYWRWVEENCTTAKDPWATWVTGAKDPELFTRMWMPYMLRRTEEDLPPERRIPYFPQPITCVLDSKRREAHQLCKKDWRVYEKLIEEIDEDIILESAGSLVHALRAITRPAKMGVLQQIVQNHGDEPVVVYCWYHATVDSVMKTLQYRKPFNADGRVPAQERRAVVDEWKKKPNGVLVSTIAALKEGENLQNSQVVIFVEFDYLDAVNRQVVGRVKRKGQQGTVTAYFLMCERSVDTAVWKAANDRALQINQVHRSIEDAVLDYLDDEEE